MSEVVSSGQTVFVKVAEINETGDPRGPKIGLSMAVVSQDDGRDLDPTNQELVQSLENKSKPKAAKGSNLPNFEDPMFMLNKMSKGKQTGLDTDWMRYVILLVLDWALIQSNPDETAKGGRTNMSCLQ